jgi:hypothetical protein
MNFVMFFFMVVLAFILSPGILVSLPPGGSKKVVALTHAIVLALTWGITHKFVWKLASK